MKKTKGLPMRAVAMLAILAAISIILGKYLAIRVGDVLRFSFENLPILFAGIVFGPIGGILVGVVADLIGCVLVGYAINPIITVGGALIGAVSGALWLIFKKLSHIHLSVKVFVTAFISHLLGSVVVKTFGLAVFYDMPFFVLMLWRLLNYVIIGVLEAVLLFILLKNKSVSAQIAKFSHRSKKREVTMNYNEALEYIHKINWTFCKPGLERIDLLCRKLGNPEKQLKFVHVAGTNGKGSFCSMLSSVLVKAGYKVGLYTSPFIYRFNERMRINGEDIPDQRLAEITEKVRPIADAMADKPTEFELITAIAFQYFFEEKCDIVVLECGMGGRLDSTNVIPSSLLSVITGISLDHTAFLGDTVEKIAAEKAGIIKRGTPVLYGGCDKAAEKVIFETACSLGSEFYVTDYGKLSVKSADLEGSVFDFDGFTDVKISLLGLYQPRNAASVLCAVTLLRERGLNIPDSAVYDGLAAASWRARFEIIDRDPTVIFDGAHNPEGIDAAVRSIKNYFGGKKVVIFTGVLSDKDYRVIAKRLSEVASYAFTITPDNKRALSAEDYAGVLSEVGVTATPCESVGEALSEGKKKAKELGTALCCLGSLYTYVEVINELK